MVYESSSLRALNDAPVAPVVVGDCVGVHVKCPVFGSSSAPGGRSWLEYVSGLPSDELAWSWIWMESPSRAVVLGGEDGILPEDLPEALLETGAFASEDDGFHASVRDVKRKRIVSAMEEAKGNYTHAARLLGVHPTYLHRLIRNLDLKGELVQRFASGRTA